MLAGVGQGVVSVPWTHLQALVPVDTSSCRAWTSRERMLVCFEQTEYSVP